MNLSIPIVSVCPKTPFSPSAGCKNACQGSVLFITKDRKSFQIKGKVGYHADGDIYADMKAWLIPSIRRMGPLW